MASTMFSILMYVTAGIVFVGILATIVYLVYQKMKWRFFVEYRDRHNPNLKRYLKAGFVKSYNNRDVFELVIKGMRGRLKRTGQHKLHKNRWCWYITTLESGQLCYLNPKEIVEEDENNYYIPKEYCSVKNEKVKISKTDTKLDLKGIEKFDLNGMERAILANQIKDNNLATDGGMKWSEIISLMASVFLVLIAIIGVVAVSYSNAEGIKASAVNQEKANKYFTQNMPLIEETAKYNAISMEILSKVMGKTNVTLELGEAE